MYRILRLFQPSLSFSYNHIGRLLWPMIFIFPFALWQFTSDVFSYFSYGAPTGQLWYVFSKLFALYAILLLWYQALSTLLKDSLYTRLFPSWSFLRHRTVGSVTLAVVVLHIACFVIAVSLRKETIAWGLLFLVSDNKCNF